MRVPKSPRKIGMLHKMVEAAANGDVPWKQVLHYIQSNCSVDENDDVSTSSSLPNSPLPAGSVPSESLRAELKPSQQTGQSLLRTVVCKHGHAVPLDVMAALIQVSAADNVLLTPDHRNRIILHYACRLAVSRHVDKLLLLLIQASPTSLLRRDDGGRTPLHYLLWYHAPDRSPQTVKAFCCKLPVQAFDSLKRSKMKRTSVYDQIHPLPDVPRPSSAKKIPANAAIVPDNRHGCWPLHYAVMNHAPVSVIQVLLQAFPGAKHAVDRFGRTALHWYLGAAYLTIPDPPSSTEKTEAEQQHAKEERKMSDTSIILHVSGEAMDPGAAPWWNQDLDPNVIRLLLSSRVARSTDSKGRSPLHWAAHFCAWQYHYSARSNSRSTPTTPSSSSARAPMSTTMAVVKLVLDHHVRQVSTRDSFGSMTPLMVLLESTAQLQQDDDACEVAPQALQVPIDCIRLFLDGPHEVAMIEDKYGQLPIHAALQVAAPANVIEMLIDMHPTSLVHTAEDSSCPLHAAFRVRYTAPLQTTDVMELLLRSYVASKHGTKVDGRLALKMEDSTGYYPIHYACQNKASVDVIRMVIDRYPQAALLQLPDGNLPVHCLVDDEIIKIAVVQAPTSPSPRDAAVKRECLETTRQKMQALIPPLLHDPTKLETADSKYGMLPLHIAVLFEAASYPILLRMLEGYPQAASQFMTDPVHTFSAMDLHDICKASYQGTVDDWQHIRELLFSFGPTLESHRHREELLSQCVRIILDEVSGRGSYHLRDYEEQNDELPELELTHTLSAMEMPVPERLPNSPPQSPPSSPKQKQEAEPQMQKTQEKGFFAKLVATNNSGLSKSKITQNQTMYDDTSLALEYDVSDADEYDDDGTDSYFSEKDSEEEEYFSESQSHGDVDTEGIGTFLTNLATSSEGRTTDYSDSILQHQSTEMTRTSGSTLEQIFDAAKRKAAEEEEKKDSEVEEAQFMLSPVTTTETFRSSAIRPDWASEVGMRLWSFFALYRDPNNPNDNYAKQVANICDALEYSLIQTLVSLPIPPCASDYLSPKAEKDEKSRTESSEGLTFREAANPKFREKDEKSRTESLEGLTFREAANPKCREIIHRTSYFLGRFDFNIDSSPDILVHRTADGSSVTVRANEWHFKTEEATEATKPGISEAEIWESGQVPAEVGLTFSALKRPVRIQFTKNFQLYEKEINHRIQAGLSVDGNGRPEESTHVVPIEQCFNVYGERKEDRIYKVDVNDVRFQKLTLLGSGSDEPEESINLTDFPCALVYTDIYKTNLSDFFHRYGVDMRQAKKICADIGYALGALHSEGVVHGNVSMRSVLLSAVTHTWSLWDLSSSVCLKDSSSSSTTISSEGFGQFSTGTLPPEMFVRLSPADVKVYRNYWHVVEQTFNVKVDKLAVEPKTDMRSGETYAVRCYFAPPKDESVEALPQLPYEHIVLDRSSDLWALGLILFHLCAGRPLFPVSARSGHLLEYDQIYGWTTERAKMFVYEHVTDNVAQDVLLRLLAPHEERMKDSIHTILSHPFFSGSDVTEIVEKRRIEAAAHSRSLAKLVSDVSEKAFLEERTIRVNLWDFQLLERIRLSPSEIVRGKLPTQSAERPEIPFPCATVLLPFICDCSAAESCKDVANRLGTALLGLSKACYFARMLKQAIAKDTRMFSRRKWTTADILQVLGLSSDDFGEVQSSLADLASKHVELFRNDPAAVALKHIQLAVKRVFECFDDSNAYLYLVDEYNCTLVANGTYPIKVPDERKQDVLQNGLMYMHLCCMYAQAISNGVLGLAKLLFMPVPAEISPEWIDASRGLHHKLDEDMFVDEITLLQEALSEMYSTRHRIAMDNLDFMRSFLYDIDPEKNFADLKRLSSADMSLWTTGSAAFEIAEASRSLPLKDVLQKMRQVTC